MMNQPMAEQLYLEDDGTFPNNRLPVLLWRNGIPIGDDVDGAATIEQRFQENDWGGSWRNGIFSYHHYHSTAHEVLGIARGNVRVMLGGPSGQEIELETGDVVLLPAGTSHRNLGASSDLLVIGAYPPGQHPDILRGDSGERPNADHNISRVALPDTDPVTGGHQAPKPWQGNA